MMKVLVVVILIVFVAGVAPSQPVSNTPAFEVASIKQAAPTISHGIVVSMGGDPGRVNYTNVTLKNVLMRAYNVRTYQISGPPWLDTQRYDILAKVPDGAPKEQIPAMLQSLLAERFKMTLHRETKEQSVYALVVGKNGPKLKSAEEGGSGVAGPGPNGGPAPKGAVMISSNGHLEARGATMAALSDLLSNLLDRPVVDMTEIKGNYDIVLDVSTEDLAGLRKLAAGGPAHGPGTPAEAGPAPESVPSASIFTAIQQIGLRLDSRKAPIEYIVVDKAEKVPTEN